LTLAVAIGGLDVFAQTEPIRGTVVDSKGAPLNGVRVVLRSPSSPDPIEEHTSDKDGAFAVSAEHFRPGNELQLQLDGYDELVVAIGGQHLVVSKIQLTMTRAAKVTDDMPPAAQATTTEEPSLSELYEVPEERKRAVEAYNKAVAMYEDNQIEDKTEAIQKFRQAASMDPTFAEPQRVLLSLAMKNQNWAEASRHAEGLIRIDPDDYEAIRALYLSLVILRHFDRVGPAALRLIAADPNATKFVADHAQAFLDNSQWRMARALYEVLAKVFPDQAEVWLKLGYCCASLGDNAAARAAFEAFLRFAPEDHPDLQAVEDLLSSMEEGQ
jgi:tetratricopeptide (TPR) repeat protein